MACSVTLALLLFAVLVQISLVSSEAHDSTLIGYGVQRLKKHTSRVNIDGHKHLKDSVTQSCDNIVQYWYTDAIIDNFAPVNEQKKWEGSGQRYWINEEFWGGIGSPIFVFIGICLSKIRYFFFLMKDGCIFSLSGTAHGNLLHD